MNKKVSLGVTVGLMALTAAVTFVVTGNISLEIFNKKVSGVNEKQEQYSKLAEADSFARNYYIGEIDETELSDDIAAGYINGLNDPYAVYYSADEAASLTSEYTGSSIGLGFSWEKDSSGYIRVSGVIENTSADEYGMKPGDIIMAVNNTNIISYPGGYSEAVKLFSSAEGTKVKLHIKRTAEDGTAEFSNYDLISSRTEIISVTGRMIGTTGYIRISAFNDNTPKQFEDLLDTLKSEGAEKYIFDVRDDQGGSMDALSEILDDILPAGDIVRAYYKDHDETVISATDDASLDAPMVVLVNNGTKGEAELFAFALRDEKGAVTVGKTTYGKGYLQEIFRCSDGSAVKISTASLRTKNSGEFNGRGLKPDHDVTLSAGVEPFRLSAEEQEKYDAQLIKAIEAAETN